MSHAGIDRAEFKRGWKVILASLLGFGSGVITVPFFAAGAFMGTLEQELHWSRGEIGVGVTLLNVFTALMAPVVGYLADRFGIRRVVILSTVGAGLGMASLSMTTSLWMFYVLWALIPILGCGTLPVTFTRVVSNWFERSRGLALGISLMGAGIAGALVPRYVAWLISDYGWRVAFLGIGLIPIVVGLPMALLFLRDSPATADAHAGRAPATGVATNPVLHRSGYSFHDAIRQPRFWRLSVATFLAPIGLVGLIVNFIPILTDAGHTLAGAAKIFSLYGVAVIFGRVGVGYLLDRFWAPAVGALALMGPAISATILVLAPADAYLPLVAGLFIGFAGGAEFDLVAYLTGRYFGLKNYGRIYGVQYMIFEAGSSVATLAFGFWYDAMKSYNGILWIAVGIFITVSALFLSLGRYPDLPVDAAPSQ